MSEDKNLMDIGMVGLGVMGRNLVYNMADNGYAVAGYDKDADKLESLTSESESQKVQAFSTIEEFVNAVKKPRAIMMLVPAGPAVDSVIDELTPLMEEGDLIIDGGNSYFKDTNKHFKELQDQGIRYIGMGISGGEAGARHGPSMMPGGQREAYDRVREILEATAAKVDGEPCVTYLGPDSAGHYVKMVHNGIEYGLMQLIAETYHLLKVAGDLSDDELHRIYKSWDEGELRSFLMEITADIFCQPDPKSDEDRLINVILDEARQKGTGKWTSQDAMELQLPVLTIDMAVGMRDMSVYKDEREKASGILSGPDPKMQLDKNNFISALEKAFAFSMIITYAEGFALLRKASRKYEYDLNPEDVARIWRGGCIIRADLLNDIMKAFQKNPDLENLLLDDFFSEKVVAYQQHAREVIQKAAEWGIPVPGFMASLSYYDGLRSSWLPANLIQAQRDYFGSHTYERIDEKGTFHTQWNKV